MKARVIDDSEFVRKVREADRLRRAMQGKKTTSPKPPKKD
jgi:hypothetical protein